MIYEKLAFRTMLAATHLQMAWVENELSRQPLDFIYSQVIERAQLFEIVVPDFKKLDVEHETFGRDIIVQLARKFPHLQDYARLGQLVTVLALSNFKDHTSFFSDKSSGFKQEVIMIMEKYGISNHIVYSWIEDSKNKRSPLNSIIEFETKLLSKMLPLVKPIVETPPAIQDSLARFREDYPNPMQAGFVIMQFTETRLHKRITKAIQSALEEFGISALRADNKEYHEDLYANILTYVYGCGFGIAVFERLQSEEFNPNVSFEVGYMLALNRPICLLKDSTLKTLHADLAGKLYRPFDVQNPTKSIRPQLTEWIREKGLIFPVNMDSDNSKILHSPFLGGAMKANYGVAPN